MHRREANTEPITEDMSRDSSFKFYEPITANESSTSSTTITFRQKIAHFFHIHSDYFWGLLYRIAAFIVILGVLIGIGIGLRYTDGLPQSEDFSQLTFDWKINPGNYLTPYNASFQYNVLMNGHSHSTYSDGKMNVRQLLEWHIGEFNSSYFAKQLLVNN